MMKPDRSTTDEAVRNFIAAAAVLGRGENYLTVSYGKSTPLSRRSDFMHGVKRSLGHNPFNEARLGSVPNWYSITSPPYCFK